MEAIDAIKQNMLDFYDAREKRSLERYFRYLVEEVGELSSSMNGRHEHTPQYELIQIGGIVANMLSKFTSEEIDEALMQIKIEHNLIVAH